MLCLIKTSRFKVGKPLKAIACIFSVLATEILGSWIGERLLNMLNGSLAASNYKSTNKLEKSGNLKVNPCP